MGPGTQHERTRLVEPTPTGTLVLDDRERSVEARNLVELSDDPTIRLVVSDDVVAGDPEEAGIIGEYLVEAVLGRGGMGVVHRARHRRLGTPVAMKLLRPEVSARPLVVRRFVREGRVLGRLRDPGIVECFEFGVAPSGTPYIVMEYMDGFTLAALLEQERKLDVWVALEIARQVARALGAAHRCGVVHRDVKPSNVFLLADPGVPGGIRAKVMDFGLAKLLEPEAEDPHPSTATGSLIGTPAFMSPEQCRGAGEIDERSDIYSLGCVLYAMLCGRPPFTGQGMGDYVTAHLLEPPAPPSAWAPELPPALDALILTALAKNPAHRQQTMDDLERELTGQTPVRAPTASTVPAPAPRRPVKALAAGVLAVLVLVVAGAAGGESSGSTTTSAEAAPSPDPIPSPTSGPIPIPTPTPTPSTEHDTRSENSSELEFSGRVDEPSRSEGAVNTLTSTMDQDIAEPQAKPAPRPRQIRKRPRPAPAAPPRARERGDVMEPKF